MKTVSTKIDNNDFDRLLEMCNDDGECISESLRGMIKQHLEAHEEYLEMKKEEKPVAKAQIIEIDGVPMSEIKNVKVVEL